MHKNVNNVPHETVGQCLANELGIKTVSNTDALEISNWAHGLALESFHDLLECDTLPETDALNHLDY